MTMQKPLFRSALHAAGFVILFCILIRGWDSIVAFLGIVLTAIIPLVLGACIAYVLSIPTKFLQRHMLPNSTNKAVEALRQPLSLVVIVVLFVTTLVFATAVLIPAFVETVTMVSERGEQFIESMLSHPMLEPVRGMVHDFFKGDFMQSLSSLDIQGILNSVLGGSMASIGTQVFTVVSTVMTGFFGLLFSFILLTDTTDVWTKVMEVTVAYIGHRRTEHLALVLGVADASFHNFIVRQCIEALILGTVGGTVLFAVHYEYALGVGMLMGLAALIPIVGYPVGLFVGAFMVAITNPWYALLYIVVVAISQMCEAMLLLPHIGDPRTVLPPVWITVGVTIGGGVAGFIGMLVAIPLASTIRQLVLIDVRRRSDWAQGDDDADQAAPLPERISVDIIVDERASGEEDESQAQTSVAAKHMADQ